MRYVNLAHGHLRPIPDALLEAGTRCSDPDQRIVAMLNARGKIGREIK